MGLFLSLPLLASAQRQRTSNWESGMLEKGQKVGEWEYYGYSLRGERIVTHRYDHTARKLTFCRPDDKAYEVEVAPGSWERMALTQPPWFIGGREALTDYTAKLNYPAPAQERNVQGKVIVSFVVDTLGRAADYRIVQGIGSGCDEEALRVSRTIPHSWLPGHLGARAVAVRYELPFTFKLN